MATPLSITTDHRDDGTLVLTATGEIDLSNLEAFADALSDGSAAWRATVRRSPSTSPEWSIWTAVPSTRCSVTPSACDVIANPILMPVLTISGLTDVASVEPAGAKPPSPSTPAPLVWRPVRGRPHEVARSVRQP